MPNQTMKVETGFNRPGFNNVWYRGFRAALFRSLRAALRFAPLWGGCSYPELRFAFGLERRAAVWNF